jgi:hypothetical protein
VVCALLHDIGDTLGSFNHPDIAAAILKPFVSEANLWMVQHHGIFQGYNFFHHIGLDRNLRDQFKDHPHCERTPSSSSATTTRPSMRARDAAAGDLRAHAAPLDGGAEALGVQGRDAGAGRAGVVRRGPCCRRPRAAASRGAASE